MPSLSKGKICCDKTSGRLEDDRCLSSFDSVENSAVEITEQYLPWYLLSSSSHALTLFKVSQTFFESSAVLIDLGEASVSRALILIEEQSGVECNFYDPEAFLFSFIA